MVDINTNFLGLIFFLMILFVFAILAYAFFLVKHQELPDFSFYNILFLSFTNFKQLNYHLIIKQNFITIIENNYFEDYSKSEIKHVAIENNKLAITLFKSDKVFNFPIEDFKEKELEVLNQFIEVQNLNDSI